jgi:cysteine desulfurase/selenocysteine lyase
MTDYKTTAYLDNAATTPMPETVLSTITEYYQFQKVNVHRGMYQLSHQVTTQYEAVRDEVADWINAQSRSEIIFTSGTTDALNLVAFGYAISQLNENDEIIVSVLEHHSNYLPWQQVSQKTGAKLRVVGITETGALDVDQLAQMINSKTKIVALTLVSNVLGTVVPVRSIADLVHRQGGILIVDVAQAVSHLKVDVVAMDADFVAFSGHKMFGPTGIGVLYGKTMDLEKVKPMRYGGEMALEVGAQTSEFQPLPLRLEAGTPNIAGVLGLGAALQYLRSVGIKSIQTHEQQLMQQLLAGLKTKPMIKIYGSSNANQHVGAVSFNMGGIHAHDVATILDSQAVAVRAGHMCAEPLMKALGVSSVVRASISLATTDADINRLLTAIDKVGEILG